ncbi:MAG: hypothetical protein ACREHD_20275, partial [Pirellulales bacterium]
MPAGSAGKWYTFTTLGDGQGESIGQPADQITVANGGGSGTQTAALAINSGTLSPDPSAAGGGYDMTPTELKSSASGDVGVIDLDLTSLLPFQANALPDSPNAPQIASVSLPLNYSNLDLPAGSNAIVTLSVIDNLDMNGDTAQPGAPTLATADLAKGDGVIDSLDLVDPSVTDPVTGLPVAIPATPLLAPDGTTTTPLSTLATSGSLTFDLTQLVRQALAMGDTRLSLKLTITDTLSGSTAAMTFAQPETSGEGLVVTTVVPGVQMQIYDSGGMQHGPTGTVIDMAGLSAGTYYLHVFDPQGVGNLPYTLDVWAPSQNQVNAPPIERATIFAGGSSTLAGGSGIDRLFGDSTDTFDTLHGQPANTQSTEPRDISGNAINNPILQAAPTSTITGTPPSQVDPVVFGPESSQPLVTNPDYGLEKAIANASGIPWTTGYNGAPVLSRPILQSDLVQLTSLNASNLNVSDLNGLQYAINLTSLYLANDNLTSLLLPALPTTSDPTPGEEPLGEVLPQLQYLVIDNNQIGDFT